MMQVKQLAGTCVRCAVTGVYGSLLGKQLKSLRGHDVGDLAVGGAPA